MHMKLDTTLNIMKHDAERVCETVIFLRCSTLDLPATGTDIQKEGSTMSGQPQFAYMHITPSFNLQSTGTAVIKLSWWDLSIK
jgi:hypothetical protein